ncbi:chaperonin 10-like protein [Thermoascus aurantiacus ATCC 26904]
MKEAITLPGPLVRIVDSPIPEPNDDQIFIRVFILGLNPKHWTAIDLDILPPDLPSKIRPGMYQGDDIAGVVERPGKNVVEFKPGDRVAAFHEMLAPGGSYSEYALAWKHKTFHLPTNISFEVTWACLWSPAKAPLPLMVYGASTAVGYFAIKLAKIGNNHPIIAVGDRTKGDTMIDDCQGPGEILEQIKQGLESAGLSEASHGLDAAVTPRSAQILRRAVKPGGYVDFRSGLYLLSLLHPGLGAGDVDGHPFEVRPHGLEGVEQALKDIKDGKAVRC